MSETTILPSAKADPKLLLHRRVRTIVFYLVLTAGSVLFLAPLAYSLSLSLQSLKEVYDPAFHWIPAKLQFDNYRRALTVMPFARFALNSIIVTGLSVTGILISSTIVAYGFARFRFPGRGFLFGICIATMMIPGQVSMIPVYVMFARLGWIDTYLPMVVPPFFAGGAFNIFLIRQFFLSIPLDLDASAKIDGASSFLIFRRILLPLARAPLTAVGIFAFTSTWNDFFSPLLYLNTLKKATLALGLNLYKNQALYSPIIEWNLIMAASLVVMIPTLLIFFVAQREFVEGISLSGLKA